MERVTSTKKLMRQFVKTLTLAPNGKFFEANEFVMKGKICRYQISIKEIGKKK